MDSLTNTLAKILWPVFRPISHWLLNEKRSRPTWHYEMLLVGLLLFATAATTSTIPNSLSNVEQVRQFLIAWVSAAAVLGSFLHAKVGYRMTEALEAQAAPAISCYHYSGRYWISKEILWFFVFLLSGAYPAIVGTIIFILYPAWRKVHVTERQFVRGNEQQKHVSRE